VRDGVEWRIDAHHESGGTRKGRISKEYRTWRGMKNRCLNPRNKQYPAYGGRGIMIWPAWIASYETFLADVGRAPTPEHTIGRIDNNGPYAPGNVRWETMREQNRNMRRTCYLTLHGETLLLADWVQRTGLNRQTIQMRKQRGYTDEQALTMPLGKHHQRRAYTPGR
jgi:hypothetical protein